jgi:arylsulfatase A-like enzyme
LAVAVLLACSPASEPVVEGLAGQLPPAPDMNVLVVSFDAMRADAMGVYGYPRETTPNLDLFAQDALVFDNAYSAAPVTPTSFAAAFTAQYPYRVFLGWQLLPAVTLAQLMQDSGRYTFGLFNNIQVAAERNFGQGFQHYEVANFSDRELLRATRDVLSEHHDRPFFGWVHFISPHTPYEYREISEHLAPRMEEGRFASKVESSYHVENEAELNRARELYDGEMFFADHLFGRLMKHLDKLGLADNTIVVVTADHGEEFMDHGRVGHKSLFEEVIRVPLLIRHPGAPGGGRTDLPYLNIDLLPTLASTVGLALPADIDGIDLRGPVPNPRTRVITGMTSKERFQIAVESGGRKLIQVCRPEFSEGLYDRNSDPGEASDVLLDQPALAGELTDLLEGQTRMEPCQLILNSVRGKAPEELLSDEQIEQLKSLGYIQ